MKKFLLFTLFLALPFKAQAAAEKAIFAGGCFWCMEAEFKHEAGVTEVVSGYTGGTVANPTYEEVSSGTTGHVEAVQVTYDTEKTSYQKMLDIFWSNVDPTDDKGQFCDKGSQYRAGIFTDGDAQKKLAEASKKKVEARIGTSIATAIRPATAFYPAEAHHQGYAEKNALHYKMYRIGCGRDRRLEELNRK